MSSDTSHIISFTNFTHRYNIINTFINLAILHRYQIYSIYIGQHPPILAWENSFQTPASYLHHYRGRFAIKTPLLLFLHLFLNISLNYICITTWTYSIPTCSYILPYSLLHILLHSVLHSVPHSVPHSLQNSEGVFV